MKYRYLILAALAIAWIGADAQDLKGNVEMYETAIHKVFLVKGNNGISNLSGDTVVDRRVFSLTAVRLNRSGKPVKSVTYESRMGMGGASGSFFSMTSDTMREISGRIDTQTGGMMGMMGNTLWTEALHFERDGFDYDVSWDEPKIWTDYKYQDGRLMEKSVIGNTSIGQSQTVTYEYNADGTIKAEVSVNLVSGRRQRTEYSYRNGRIESLEISYFNYQGKETGVPSALNFNGNIENFQKQENDAVLASAPKREKRTYTYGNDGSWQIRFSNDGTGRTEHYDSGGRLLKTVLADGSVLQCRYNSHGDPILLNNVLQGMTVTVKYDSYKYDSHGNWTRRRVFKADEDGFMIPEYVEYRRLSYRDGEKFESKAFINAVPRPWYVHVTVAPDNSFLGINLAGFSMGTEMKNVDETTLNRLKQLPGFKDEGDGIFTLEGHPLVISKVVATVIGD